MAGHYQIYCAGEFIDGAIAHSVINPYNQSPVASTSLADATILNTAVTKALAIKEEFGSWSSLQKFQALKFISEAILANRTHLAIILASESAKPIKYALAEIDRSAQTFLIAAEEAKRLPKEYISLDWTPNGSNREGIINYTPIGLIAGIAPFNFPMNLAVHKLAPAIAAGCPIILKPASSTPLSCLELAKIIDQAGLPKGAVSILPMNRETGNLLVTDDRFKLLSFTGSPEVGWKMKAQSGKKKIVLELGGNAAVIVTQHCDLNTAIQKSLNGAFAYSGQICIHAQRFMVHASVLNAFTEGLKQATLILKAGDPLDVATDVAHMIDEENAKRVETWIQEAQAQGAKLVCGGKRNRNYIEPTILTHCTNQMKVYAGEVFGPVICINPYDSIEDAIQQVNDTRFGLQCGIFTDRISELDACFKKAEVGGVIHNDVPTLRFDHMPYGGVKDSGLGREGVKYALLDMLEPRILVK